MDEPRRRMCDKVVDDGILRRPGLVNGVERTAATAAGQLRDGRGRAQSDPVRTLAPGVRSSMYRKSGDSRARGVMYRVQFTKKHSSAQREGRFARRTLRGHPLSSCGRMRCREVELYFPPSLY